MSFKKLFIFIFVTIISSSLLAQFAFAAGNIDSVQKYSQFLNLNLDNNSQNDFINWDPTNGGATVTDTAVSGYIWGETVGWINLNPTEAGVANSCSGVLGGYGWGENTGWINFDPTDSQTGNVGGENNLPEINTTTGQITGTVWTQNYGWVQLSSLQTPTGGDPYVAYSPSNPDSGLITTWRPSSGCSSSPVNGMCGTSNGGSFSSAPSSNLCTAGTSSTPVSTGSGWIWECSGTGGGTTASCSAAAPTSGGGGGGGTGGGCALPFVLINGTCQIPTTTPPTTPPTTGTSSSSTTTTTPPTTNPVVTTTPTTGGSSGSIPVLPIPTLNPTSYPPAQSPIGISGASSNGSIPSVPVLNIAAGIFGGKASSYGWILPLIALLGLLSTLPGLVTRIANMLAAFIFGRKRARGIVYDSENKEPLDPAYVSVIDLATNQEITSQITDIHGRYGFILKPGTYKMTAGKTHYAFPSQKLFGKTSDELYSNLYFGEPFTITDPNQVVTMNIPMDPIAADWNQIEKERTSIVHAFISTPSWLVTLLDILFVVGFIVSLAITYYYPIWWNILMSCLYVVIAIAQSLGYGPIHAGVVKKNGMPLPFAIVRAYNATLNREIAHTVTSSAGGYYMLVPKGDYYLTIEMKNSDGTYTNIATTPVVRAHSGVISRSFEL